MVVQENILLSPYTTLHLGGEARYFCPCTTVAEVKEALRFARSKHLRFHILGGGSNTIFADHGFDGVIIKIGLLGVSFMQEERHILVTAKAGEDWERFVGMTVEKGYAGVECLSGIPGSVGAVPIQNVGAYGQEVKETIVAVSVLDTETYEEKKISNADCRFGYRQSRFKHRDAGKYVVTEVTFRLEKNGRPTINYPEVKKTIEASVPLDSLAAGRESLSAVRDIVIALRKKKSMVIDPNDPNTRSVGSFFMNPVVAADRLAAVAERWAKIGDGSPMPIFAVEGKTKIPAAWLIEKSGFSKGYTKNRVGISGNHTLALVNRGGTAAALIALAEEIRSGVQETFGIRLDLEPNIIV